MQLRAQQQLCRQKMLKIFTCFHPYARLSASTDSVHCCQGSTTRCSCEGTEQQQQCTVSEAIQCLHLRLGTNGRWACCSSCTSLLTNICNSQVKLNPASVSGTWRANAADIGALSAAPCTQRTRSNGRCHRAHTLATSHAAYAAASSSYNICTVPASHVC
jgi:hypothetical protein